MTLEEFIKECESLRDDFTWSKQEKIIRGVRKDHKDSYCPLTALCYKKTGKDLPKSLYYRAVELLKIDLETIGKPVVRASDNVENHADSLPLFNQLCVALGITKAG